nr:methyl-accepting chemotaxis protein [uncultured Desulfobacter sp.]
MNLFKNFKIKHRLYLVALLMVLLSIMCTYFIVHGTSAIKKTALDELDLAIQQTQKEKLKAVTHSMAVSIAQGMEKIEDEANRIEYIRHIIEPIRFEDDKSGYFYVYKGTVNVAHPINKKLIGKDLKDLKDPNGVYSIRELRKAAENGGGYCFFTWEKPGVGLVLKLGYAEMIPGTQVWIGTGVYLDNIQAYKDNTGEVIRKEVYAILTQTGTIGGLVLLIVVYSCFSVVFGVTKSLKLMQTGITHVEQGDFTQHIKLDTKDELGVFSGVFDRFIQTLNKTMGDILDQSKLISDLAETLNKLSSGMSEEALKSAGQANDVSVGAKAMNDHMDSVVLAMEQASQNIEQIAAATEQISATVQEITRRTETTVDTTKQATKQAKDTAQRMSDLSKSTAEIGNVTQVIQDISEQTHLLSLNATIEASRAGEAGKGFAVVADEIRQLARQTANATEEIREKVDNIQTTVAVTRKDILNVEKIIEDANQSVQQVQASVSEQALATEEISRNIQQTSASISDTTQSVHQAGQMTEKISKDVSLVHDASDLIAENSQHVKESATKLNATSVQFAKMAGQFKITRGN